MAAKTAMTAPEASVARTKVRASASAQVNARIDPELKRLGDEGLAAAGLTPTQAVRALWSMAASCVNEPERLRAALLPKEIEEERQGRETERRRRVELARAGADIMKSAYRDMGLDWPPSTSGLSYEELKELAYRERFPEAFESSGA